MFSFKMIRKLINLGPLILLYYLSISEIDTHFENYFEILSFNIQLIIIYFWILKRPSVLGNGHIFFAGLFYWDVIIYLQCFLLFVFVCFLFFILFVLEFV